MMELKKYTGSASKKKEQQQVQGMVRGRRGVYGENDE
jgi:hypothetical protein